MLRIESWLTRLADFQHRRAGLVLLLALVVSGVALTRVRHLRVDPSFVALLPEDKPSVRDLQVLGDRIGGLRTLAVVVRSPSRDVGSLDRFIREAAPRVGALRGLGIRYVDYTLGAFEGFVDEHRGLYASVDDLTEIRDSLEERLNFERARANPFFVSLDDDEPEDPHAVLERIRLRNDGHRSALARFPGGLYISEAHDFGVFFVRCDFPGGDTGRADALIGAVRRELAAMRPESYGRGLSIELAGNVVVSREEHDAILQEVSVAGGLTTVISMLAILVFFRRPRVIPILGISLIVPVLVTFAFAELAVGKLNTSTAFLGSIVFGNGVNPMIMWLARYVEERRAGRSVAEAMRRTHLGTWAGTLTAAVTAAAAYGSLVATDFRGFHDFGIIGSAGQLLAWTSMLLVVPAATAFWERLRPHPIERESSSSNPFGAAVWSLVSRRPAVVVAIATTLGIVSTGVIAYAIAHDPLEYDFRKLRSERTAASQADQWNHRIGELLRGNEDQAFIAMVLPERRLVEGVRAQLERGRTTNPPNYGRIRTIDDLLPDHQPEKLVLLAEIRELLSDIRPHVAEDQRDEIDAFMPAPDLRPLGDADLPEEVARRFTERDGTRGRLVAVERAPGVSIWDGRYLQRWAAAVRRVRLPDGTRPPLAGEAPVFADLVDSIVEDAPRTVALSFTLTVLLVVTTFRRWRDRLLTLGALGLGLSVMGASMAALGLRINFLNFIAIPIAFGLGVEYAVNVMQRYVQDEAAGHPEPAEAAVAETGGAVVLCSLTTIAGYVTLHASQNQAIRSFGDAGGISEVACITSAVFVIPAVLLLLSRRRRVAVGS